MSFILNNKLTIPAIGFGTWQLTEDVEKVITEAVKAGYKHIDTAAAYGNEAAIGATLKKLNVNRETIFLTSKVWKSDLGYESTLKAFEQSLHNLQTDYLDLYLIHWPVKNSESNWEQVNAETWRALEYLYKNGKVKAIGVSNFLVHHLESLLENSTIKPMVNQIEYHPGYLQPETVTYCKAADILVEAWSPIGSGRLLQDSTLVKMAKKYNVQVAQLCIQFALQNNIVPLPKSTNSKNIAANIQFEPFVIAQEDLNEIYDMNEVGFSGLLPDLVPF
ncbi:aldo/keto reductase [Flavobacterium agricola]|uniref:Aldo/keto reductase n=1 Tax=Flavobacterium agricola TaxID=2870839 RepID=A0ABY6M030_9FLAO|nr:aldo/keto reductase [Flavobacterium agricola]UYW01637.1 aldo/keto reductase [Flavobacterium agricola]